MGDAAACCRRNGQIGNREHLIFPAEHGRNRQCPADGTVERLETCRTSFGILKIIEPQNEIVVQRYAAPFAFAAFHPVLQPGMYRSHEIVSRSEQTVFYTDHDAEAVCLEHAQFTRFIKMKEAVRRDSFKIGFRFGHASHKDSSTDVRYRSSRSAPDGGKVQFRTEHP